MKTIYTIIAGLIALTVLLSSCETDEGGLLTKRKEYVVMEFGDPTNNCAGEGICQIYQDKLSEEEADDRTFNQALGRVFLNQDNVLVFPMSVTPAFEEELSQMAADSVFILAEEVSVPLEVVEGAFAETEIELGNDEITLLPGEYQAVTRFDEELAKAVGWSFYAFASINGDTYSLCIEVSSTK